MRSGRNRHKVILEKMTHVTDETGGNNTEFAPICTIWMGLEPIRVKESIQSDSLIGTTMFRGVSRYVKGIVHTNRIRWGDRLFDVVGRPKNINEMNVEMEWVLQEIGENG